ncbi:MAG: hypothetical protein VXX18_06805 [Bacteroidota bacterium]|nr:hypothetical protein [Bacteroidota bacterium]
MTCLQNKEYFHTYGINPYIQADLHSNSWMYSIQIIVKGRQRAIK